MNSELPFNLALSSRLAARTVAPPTVYRKEFVQIHYNSPNFLYNMCWSYSWVIYGRRARKFTKGISMPERKIIV